MDYLGESEGWPSKGYRTTLVSLTNVRKPWSYFIQSLYTDQPMVALAVDNPDFVNQPKRDAGGNFMALLSHWNFPAAIGMLRVYTFTNVPVVELRLNGKSLGDKRAADFADHIILWDVPNQAGQLQAIAKEDGKVVASQGYDKKVRLWDLAAAKEIASFDLQPFWGGGLQFSPDGKVVLTAGWDHSARLWSAATGELLHPPLRHQHMLYSVTPGLGRSILHAGNGAQVVANISAG